MSETAHQDVRLERKGDSLWIWIDNERRKPGPARR
jgi:hypothetical protein